MSSQKGSHALHALLALGREATSLSSRAIARVARIPPKYLEVILGDLRRAGLVTTRRGRDGGHALARPLTTIRAGDVLRAVGAAPVRPAARGRDPVEALLWRAAQAHDAVLDGTTLDELAHREPPLDFSI